MLQTRARAQRIKIALTTDGRAVEVIEDYEISELEREFLEACGNFDLDKVRKCIDHGVDVNVRSEDLNWFGLKYAAVDTEFSDESKELCDILLSHPKIDLQNKDHDRNTAIVLASRNLSKIKYVNYEVLRKLVDPLRKLNKIYHRWNMAEWRRNLGEATLNAVLADDVEFIEFLDELGAGWYHRDEAGKTPAMIAASKKECWKLFPKFKKVYWNKQDEDGNTVAMLAVTNNNLEYVKMLSKVNDIDWTIQNNEGVTPLIHAVQNDNIECVRILSKIKSKFFSDKFFSENVATSFTVAIERNLPAIIQIIFSMPDLVINERIINKLKQNRQKIHELAVDECKKYVSKMMDSDVNKEGNNISLLIFALQNKVNDRLVKLLVSRATTRDILDLVIYSSHQKAESFNEDEEVDAIMTAEGNHKMLKRQEKTFERFKKFVSGKFQKFFGKAVPDIEYERKKKMTKKRSKEKIQRSFENLGGEIIGFAL